MKRDGSLKARLCVQGCCQMPGVDYDQTHCSTMRSASMRLLASAAARFGMHLRRWDFASAYLQGTLEDGEVVWCHLPPGYSELGADGRPRICKVVKPIYGMAQAGRRWQRSLFPWLENELGFTRLHSDRCVFTKERTNPDGTVDRLLVGIYVDDLCTAYTSDAEGSLYAEFIAALQSRWEVDDEGEVSDLLGVEFVYGERSVTLHQASYIARLVAEFGSGVTKPSGQGLRTPCTSELPIHVAEALLDDTCRDPVLVKLYQSLVGALLYCATNTRPDIAFALGYLCRAVSRPTTALLEDARRVLFYLERTSTLGLTYEADQRAVYGYSDSDWGVKHSTTGWCFVYNSAVISWNSSKQTSVALSSCEAELMAASDAAKEGKWWAAFEDELNISPGEPLDLGVDNQAARDLAYNPEHHKRTKHIDRRHFFVRELVEEGILRVPFVSTKDNWADFFTKALDANRFIELRSHIMNTRNADAAAAYTARVRAVRGGVEPRSVSGRDMPNVAVAARAVCA